MRLQFSKYSSVIIFKIMSIALLLALHCQVALAQDASINNLAVVNSDTHLLAFFSVENCFTDEMLTGIHNGIPATFTYYVDIEESRKMWPDKKIFSYSFDRTLSFDSLKEQYTVFSSDRNSSKITESLQDAKMMMADITDLETIQMGSLSLETIYTLRVKAKLEKKTLPWYYQYLFPFSSFWDFETGWTSLEFSIN